MTTHCHVYIAKLAQEMAGATYESWAKNDKFYKKYPSQRVFIARKWGHFVEPARAMLVEMLRRPIAEPLKEEISRVLIADAPLRHGRHRSGAHFQIARS